MSTPVRPQEPQGKPTGAVGDDSPGGAREALSGPSDAFETWEQWRDAGYPDIPGVLYARLRAAKKRSNRQLKSNRGYGAIPASMRVSAPHSNASYVKLGARNQPLPTLRRADDLFYEIRDTDEGAEFYLWGRGRAVVSYDWRVIEHECRRRLTRQELHELELRPNFKPTDVCTRVEPLEAREYDQAVEAYAEWQDRSRRQRLDTATEED